MTSLKRKFEIPLYAILLAAFVFIVLLSFLLANMVNTPESNSINTSEEGDTVLIPGQPADLVFLPAAAGGGELPEPGSGGDSFPGAEQTWNIVYIDVTLGPATHRFWACVDPDDSAYEAWTIHSTFLGTQDECISELTE